MKRATTASNIRKQVVAFSVAFLWFYFIQKVANNFEGVSKIPGREAFKVFGLGPGEIGALMTSISVGWYVKALLGVITDGLPIFGYRRKPWLLISNLIAMAAWLWIASGAATSVTSLALGLTFVNVGIAFSDVVVDGLMVQSAQRLEDEGEMTAGTLTRSLQGWQWFGASLAVVISALTGGVIAAVADMQMAALVSAGALVLVLPAVFLVKEERVAWDSDAARRGAFGFGLAIVVAGFFLWTNGLPEDHWFVPFSTYVLPLVVIGSMLLVVRIPRNLWAPVLLIFLWQFTPFLRDSTVFFQYFTQDNTHFLESLKTDPVTPFLQQFMVTLQIATPDKLAGNFPTLFYGTVIETVFALGNLLGALVTIRYLSKVSFGKMFRWCLVGNAISFVAFLAFPLGINNTLLLMAAVALSGFVYMTAVLAVVGYSGARTPAFGQASIFAFLMGMSNLGQQLGVETFGAWLYGYAGGAHEVGEGDAVQTVVPFADYGFMVLALGSLGFLVVLTAVIKMMEVQSYVDIEE